MQQRPSIGSPDPANLLRADKQHIRLTYIVQFYFNKESNATLIDLLRGYEKYSSELLDRVQFVVVDDASPLRFDIPDFDLNITWLRILDDIPWNLGGARNLGAVYAKSDKILMTDLRCEFPEHTLEQAAHMPNTGRRIYRFYRKSEKTGALLPLAHANSFLMSRGHFFRLYGYDEEFCGNYGYFGGWLTQFHRYHGTWVLKMPRRYYYFRHDATAPDRDHNLKRDKSANKTLYERKRNEVRHWGAEAGHSRLFLNFRWEVVKQQRRKNRPMPKVDRVWKRRAWLRTLLGTYR